MHPNALNRMILNAGLRRGPQWASYYANQLQAEANYREAEKREIELERERDEEALREDLI